MSDAFLGEIRIFAGNFAPANWAFCDGQLLSIASNTALFSVLGVQYGGNGSSTFALPNLQGSVPIGAGAGPGLTQRMPGDVGGSAAVTLTPDQIPAHTHAPQGCAADGTLTTPGGNVWSQDSVGGRQGKTPVKLFNPTPDTAMAPAALAPAGANAAHNNMQPFLTLNYIICLSGIFPSRP